MRTPWIWTAAIAATLIALPSPDAPLADDDHAGHDHGEMGHGMDADAAMAEWVKLGQPGEPHAAFEWYLGDWKVESKMYMGGPEPMVSEGSVRYEWLLPGRHLMGTLTTTMMGKPMTGKSLDGYDNATGEYWNVWLDDMSTGPFISRGTETSEGVVEYHAEMFDPAFGQAVPHRSVSTRTGDDSFTFTMYMTPPGGEEMMIMEASYTRM